MFAGTRILMSQRPLENKTLPLLRNNKTERFINKEDYEGVK